ncbi:MAG: HPF/RaiA family ribosome-associated protein [Myxococcales bacterium]|nr:HPF/RaiA family ribosome-associated protein [Myxococcales bacterium]
MPVPVEIKFRHLEPSEALEARIRERASALERLNGRITNCQVTVESPHQHHHKGQLYAIRVQLSIPGDEVLVNRGANADQHAHEDPYVAVRDAFDAAERQLSALSRKHDPRGRGGSKPPAAM